MRPAETEVELSEVKAKGEPWALLVRELTGATHTVHVHTLATVSDVFDSLEKTDSKFATCQLVLGGEVLEHKDMRLIEIMDEVNNEPLIVIPIKSVARPHNSNRLFSAAKKAKKPESSSASQPSRCSIM